MSRHKDRVQAAISGHRDEVIHLAHDIHEHPEIAYAEEYAAAHIAEYLANQGFEVQSGIGGMPTAFVATVGPGPLHVAFCAEYDALPPACSTEAGRPSSSRSGWVPRTRTLRFATPAATT